MRPAGPEPGTNCSSIPSSRARFLTAGEASGRSPAVRVVKASAAALAGAALGASVLADAGRVSALAGSAAFGAGAGAVAASAFTLPAPSTLKLTSGPPTACATPGSPCRATTTPDTGLVISTVALSVMTSARIWSSETVSPTLTCQPTSSASAVPSPTSGSLKT